MKVSKKAVALVEREIAEKISGPTYFEDLYKEHGCVTNEQKMDVLCKLDDSIEDHREKEIEKSLEQSLPFLKALLDDTEPLYLIPNTKEGRAEFIAKLIEAKKLYVAGRRDSSTEYEQ